jgi:hypothetical protein
MPLARYRAYKAEGRFASNYLDSEEQVVKCQPAGGGIARYGRSIAPSDSNRVSSLLPAPSEAEDRPKEEGMPARILRGRLPIGCILPGTF